MKKLSLVVLFFVHSLNAQPYSRQVEGIPVQINAANVALPFAGGVNSPNHQFVDIDTDGDFDLFVLDVDPPVEFYRNEGTRFAPNFKPRNGVVALPQISRWFLFYDVDGDGLLDLLADDSTFVGVTVFKNTGTPTSPIFTLFAATLKDSSNNDVFAGQSSIPALVDIDGDGDYDFFSSNYDGTVNFYQNIGGATNFLLAFRTVFWQNIVIFGDTCTTAFARPTLHGASAYRFADINGNGTHDLFIGDLFSTGIFFLQNIGTPSLPHMVCNTGHFPTNQPVISQGFNQPTFVDIDGDNDLDLFVGVLGGIIQNDGFWFYRNNGTVTSPLLQLQSKNFLSMIDVGMNSHPTFADIDADGMQDMFVGNLNGQLAYFRNVGATNAPSFRLIDSTYQNIGGGFSSAPTFVDIDNNGTKDLFIGMFDGRIKHYRNVGTPQAALFALEPSPVDTITVAFNAAPAFVDIDDDGDMDLFIGTVAGRIRFYENNGSATLFRPVLQSSNYQNILVGQNAFPTFTDIDGDGDFDLFIGTSEGRVEFYENIGTRTNAQFTRRTNRYANTEPMSEAAPVFVDIDNDGDKDLFIGVQRGGIHFYRNQLITSSVEEAGMPTLPLLAQNYPNPFNSSTTITYQVASTRFVSLKVFNVLGQEVSTLVREVKAPGTYSTEWTGEEIPSGVYFYTMRSGSFTATRRMLLIK